MSKVFTLHGWSFDSSVWSLSSYKDAVHLELPGHGNSPFKSQDVVSLAKEIGDFIPEKSTLVGWSLGATVFSLTAFFYPEKIEKLVLFSPTPAFSGISQKEVVVKRFLKNLSRDFKKTVIYFRSLCSKHSYPILDLSPEVVVNLLSSFCKIDISPYLDELKVPIEIFVGEKDEITKLEGAFLFWKRVKKGKLSVVPGEDHLTILTSFRF
ncbi:MAG: alpha/beta fold hydrolase [Desulfurobacteriaceae bacterium]